MKYTFRTNINCGGCVSAVTPIFAKLDHIEEWSVDTNHPDKLLTVSTKEEASAVEKVISEAGFEISLLSSAN